MKPGNRCQREEMLRTAVLAGDERAWQTWYEETFDDLYAYIRWRCAGLRDRTDEVVQETWLTAVRRVGKFDPKQGAFSAWMRGIAANVLRNHLRRQKTQNNRQQPLDAEPVSPDAADDALASRQRAERIVRALAELPEHYEAVLRAKYMDNLSVARIAELRGETAKAVESLLGRARRTFREVYRKLEPKRTKGN